jgi:hypothetical protein
MAVEIVFIVLPAVIDQKVFFLINQAENITSACLKIRSQLNGQSRTRLLAEPSVDASCEIDPKPSRIAAPVLSLGRLHGDTADRADGRTEVAGHTSFFSIRVTSQYNDGSRPGRKGPLVFRILLGHRFSEENLRRRYKSPNKTLDPFHKNSFYSPPSPSKNCVAIGGKQ